MVKTEAFAMNIKNLPKEKRVLIVDDERITRTVVRHAFKDSEYAITEAVNAEDAIRLFEQFRHDIVVLDIVMPGSMQGLQIVAKLRDLEWRANLADASKKKRGQRLQKSVIVMLSNKDDVFSKEEAKRCGADGYITKPFRPKHLLATCHQLIKERRGGLLNQFLRWFRG